MKRQFCFARVAVTCCRFAGGACLITLLVLQWPGIATAQTVVRGPYLAVGTPSSVVVRWRTDVATNSRAQVGPAPGNLTMGVVDADTTTEHIAEITGLLPETRYYYSVGTNTAVLAGDDSLHFFRTSPLPGTARPTRVWVIGDSGSPEEDAAVVRDAYLSHPGSEQTDVWLMLGDNAYESGTDAEHQAAVFDMYPQLLRNTILWPTRGNHDLLYAGDNNDYYDIFSMPTAGEAGGLASGTEAYYSFDFANIHFICLDSHESSLEPSGPMFTWMALDLAATSQDWIIAYWHHPPYSDGSHKSDDGNKNGGRLRDMRENALPILEARGVDLVLSGHSHSYERSFLLDEHYDVSSTLHDSMKVDAGDGSVLGDGAYHKPTLGPAPHEGAVYMVNGVGSASRKTTPNHPVMVTSLGDITGSVVLDINGNQLDAVFIDNTGIPRDDFTIIKGTVVTAIGKRARIASPQLLASAPNPFAFSTRIRYTLPSAGRVSLAIYDVTGRRVAGLIDGHQVAGDYTAHWNGRRADGRRVARGVYFGVLHFGGEKRTRKIVFVR